MISFIIHEKTQALLLFISSFTAGMAFIESHPVIGNFIGSALITLMVSLIKLIKKNKKF